MKWRAYTRFAGEGRIAPRPRGRARDLRRLRRRGPGGGGRGLRPGRACSSQLTDLPDNVADMASFGARNNRIRGEGTHNLLAAAVAAGAEQFIAQSIAWEQSDDARRAVTAGHERTVLQAGGVVIRYGQLWGPGTCYETKPPGPAAHPPGRRRPDDPGFARRSARRDPGGRRPRRRRLKAALRPGSVKAEP